MVQPKKYTPRQVKVSCQGIRPHPRRGWFELVYQLVVNLKKGCRKNAPVLLRIMNESKDYTLGSWLELPYQLRASLKNRVRSREPVLVRNMKQQSALCNRSTDTRTFPQFSSRLDTNPGQVLKGEFPGGNLLYRGQMRQLEKKASDRQSRPRETFPRFIKNGHAETRFRSKTHNFHPETQRISRHGTKSRTSHDVCLISWFVFPNLYYWIKMNKRHSPIMTGNTVLFSRCIYERTASFSLPLSDKVTFWGCLV